MSNKHSTVFSTISTLANLARNRTVSAVDTIIALSEGKIVSVIGRITEVDDSRMVIYTQDKTIQKFHVVLTDHTGSIKVTIWDRTEYFENFHLGDVIELHDVIAKLCREAFNEYGPISLTFNRGSRIGLLLECAVQSDVTKYPRATNRIPRPQTVSSAPSCSYPPPIKKRPHEEDACPARCDAPSKPFCLLTGKPHAAHSTNSTAGKPYGSETGPLHM